MESRPTLESCSAREAEDRDPLDLWRMLRSKYLCRRRRWRRWERTAVVLDLTFVAITIVFFVVSIGYVAACDRLMKW